MACTQSEYEYLLELRRDAPTGGGELLSEDRLDDFDWRPALEWATWTATCKRPRLPLVLDTSVGLIEPRWHPKYGAPTSLAWRWCFLTRTMRAHAAPGARCVVPLSVFKSAAEAASAALVQAGALADGDTFRYRVSAYPRHAGNIAAPAGAPAPFSVEPVVTPMSPAEGIVSRFLTHAERMGPADEHAMSVFLPRSLLREVFDLTQLAGAAETGGVLIGQLRFDACIPELFLEVTAQIPAIHAEQELTSLTLTPDTWSAVDAALRLRDRDEIYLGWWHSHPVRQWCAQCPEEKRRRCKLTGEFFSSHDVALHRCCFPKGYSVALVVSDAVASGLTVSLYGWHKGLVAKRGFHVIDDQ